MKLLIANRGEIALRVIRTARRLGIRTIAVYSDADRSAPHVRAADAAVRIGPAAAAESYLDIDSLLDAARRTGADAVHPGYGFLSERADFARAVTEAGLTFVGPTAEVMEQLGRKDRAREVAVAAGVPVVPQVVLDTAAGASAALSAGDLPVLVKAAAGGGGKGMRIVRRADELGAALDAAGREARAAFGDDTLLLERYVERGRHVEVQILADHHGHVVHLLERDCSVQRRHQKVLEEAPAAWLDPTTRQLLLDSAVALARHVGYRGAGTVEFLVEAGATPGVGVGGDPVGVLPEVYFLEVNTRLQVEHPVTEAVVRVAGQPIDLVELQLRVAAGEPLRFTQADVSGEGHAIEARVYAEDAFSGFLPQAGRAEVVRWTPRARVDAALESGAEVGTAYDPMLGKVIAAGPTRDTARLALVGALDDCAVLGLTTNLGFVRALAASPAFADDEVDTAWLDRNPDAVRPPDPEVPLVLAAWELSGRGARHNVDDSRHQVPAIVHVAGGGRPDPFATADGWRLGGPPASTRVKLVVDGQPRTLSVGAASVDGHRVHDAGTVGVNPGSGTEAGLRRLEIDGVLHQAVVRPGPAGVEVAYRGHTFRFLRPQGVALQAAGPADGAVTAPMPGTVLSVEVLSGSRVAQGELLGVLEAMKMELALTSPFAGTVTRVEVAAGTRVALGAPLFTVVPD